MKNPGSNHGHPCFWLSLALLLVAGCSKSITDDQGRSLPAVGHTVQLIEKHGWLPVDERAVAEMMTLPKLNMTGLTPEQVGKQLDDALDQNVELLKQKGQLIQAAPGCKVRIVGYYNGESSSISPLGSGDERATWVKVEILEGDASHKTGFTTTDGVAE